MSSLKDADDADREDLALMTLEDRMSRAGSATTGPAFNERLA